MKVKVVCSSDLSDEHIAAWKRIQGANSCFASPFFRPEFTLSVAQLRDDVEVGIIEDGGRYGFFPFHRRGTVGKPIGLRLSDFQAVIVDPAMDWDAIRLIHDCGLRSWRFDHLIASQVPLQPYQWVTQPSPYVDLSEGFDAYLGRQRSAGSSSILQILRKSRKIQREVGPLRFEFNSSCHDDFQKLLTWKSHQRTATRSFDILRFNWARRCLEAIRTADTEGFGGILSALYVGNDLIAAHLGMRSRGVLHSWFPAFNPAYARYSPGMLLFLEIFRTAPSWGVRHIDFGRGSEAYKGRLKSSSTFVAQGVAHENRANRMMGQALSRVGRRLRSSGFSDLVRTPKRMIRRQMLEWEMS